jgi:hypothetical protein
MVQRPAIPMLARSSNGAAEWPQLAVYCALKHSSYRSGVAPAMRNPLTITAGVLHSRGVLFCADTLLKGYWRQQP